MEQTIETSEFLDSLEKVLQAKVTAFMDAERERMSSEPSEATFAITHSNSIVNERTYSTLAEVEVNYTAILTQIRMGDGSLFDRKQLLTDCGEDYIRKLETAAEIAALEESQTL